MHAGITKFVLALRDSLLTMERPRCQAWALGGQSSSIPKWPNVFSRHPGGRCGLEFGLFDSYLRVPLLANPGSMSLCHTLTSGVRSVRKHSSTPSRLVSATLGEEALGKGFVF